MTQLGNFKIHLLWKGELILKDFLIKLLFVLTSVSILFVLSWVSSNYIGHRPFIEEYAWGATFVLAMMMSDYYDRVIKVSDKKEARSKRKKVKENTYS